MSRRREFPAKVKVAAFERSKGLCEKCGARLAPGNVEYDHGLANWLGGEPTLENCVVLCRNCHRGPGQKTAQDIKVIARAKRLKQGHIGAKPPSRNPLPGGRASGLKRKVGGSVVRRDEA
jgi:5-methylcytosine-specific restriction protein A